MARTRRIKSTAAFSGIEIDAYVAIDNHFHVACRVVRREDPVPEDELLRRVAALKGEKAAEDLASHWKELREIGMESSVAAAQERLRARMNDISEFMKTFKEAFNVWYKRERKHRQHLERQVVPARGEERKSEIVLGLARRSRRFMV